MSRWHVAGVLLCLLSVSLSVRTGAKEFEGSFGHFRDWCEVLGIDPKETTRAVKEGLKKVADEIDDVEAFRSRIKQDKRFSRFNVGDYGHRLLFHWGYACDPEKHAPLTERIDRLDWDEETKSAFYELLKVEQARRERNLTDYAGDTFGLYTRVDRRAFAAILYDVHLLGDHIMHSPNTEVTVTAIGGLDSVIRSLETRLDKDLLRKDPALAKKMIAAIKAATETTAGNRQASAETVVSALKKTLPSCIVVADGGRYERALSKKGIVLHADLGERLTTINH